jgi:hypothetical protein
MDGRAMRECLPGDADAPMSPEGAKRANHQAKSSGAERPE